MYMSPPQKGGVPPLWGGGGVWLYVCVIFRKLKRETISIRGKLQGRFRGSFGLMLRQLY